MIDVSVVIVTWNSEKYIDDCLSSIYKNTLKHTFEVIVVDNGSEDCTAEIIRGKFPDVVLLQTGANLGFSPANNYAMGFARGRYFFLLNPDTYFSADVIGELIDFMEEHPDASCAGPKMVEKNGNVNRFQIRELPTLSGTIFAQFGLRKVFPDSRLFAKEVLPDFDRKQAREVPFIGGAAMMFPRSVFDDLGLLDEQIPMYFEDLDICARIIAAGRRSYFVHTAELVHLGRMSSNSSPARPLLHEMENGQALWLYFMRYRGRLHAASFTAIMLLSSILRTSVFFVLYQAARVAKPDAGTGLKNRMSNAWTLTRWALSNKSSYEERISGIFQKRPGSALPPITSNQGCAGITGHNSIISRYQNKDAQWE